MHCASCALYQLHDRTHYRCIMAHLPHKGDRCVYLFSVEGPINDSLSDVETELTKCPRARVRGVNWH